MTYVPWHLRHGAASISDLHYRLGKLVEHKPGSLTRSDGGGTYDTNRRYFREIEPVYGVDLSTTERLAEAGREHLASLSPERREQLQREWSDPNCKPWEKAGG